MSDVEPSVERSRLSLLSLILFCVAFAPLSLGLALIESVVLGAAGLSIDGPQYIALISILNVVALALIFIPLRRFERAWFVAGVPLNVAICVGLYLLLVRPPLGSIGLPSSLPSKPLALPDIARPAPSRLPSQTQQPPSGDAAPAPSAAPQVALPRADIEITRERDRLTQQQQQSQEQSGNAAPTLAPTSPGPIASQPPIASVVPPDEVPRPELAPSPALPSPGQVPSLPALPGSPPFPSAGAGGAGIPRPPLPNPAIRPFDKGAPAPSPPIVLRPASPAAPVTAPGLPTPSAQTAQAQPASPTVSPPPAAAPSGEVGRPSGSPRKNVARKTLRPKAAAKATAARPATAPPPIIAGPTPAGQPPNLEKSQGQTAFWNTWFVDGVGPASNALIANNTYTYSLDLSAFNYSTLRKVTQSSGVQADAPVQGLIADTTVSEVTLTIKPIVPQGSALRLADTAASYPMKVDLTKIRNPDTGGAEKYAKNQLSIAELSKQTAAGIIQIPVFADTTGCAVIAFSIFKGLRPLDHLVQRVAVGADDKSIPACDSDDSEINQALSGGLEPLREVSLGMEGFGPSLMAAGAFHIFDFSTYSMVVFVDGRPGKEQSVYGWQTESSVVDYLKADNFQNLIIKARNDSANNIHGSYAAAAQELSKVVFSTKPGSPTAQEAKNALAAFKSLVEDSPAPPLIVVRVASTVVDGQNRSIYVPLGILGADGPAKIVDKPIVVVQPMAIERFPSADKCIGEWTFAVPDKLENVPDKVMPPDFFPAKYPGKRIIDMQHFRPYLAGAPAVAMHSGADSSKAVGLVVLAHQDEGFLWFAQSTDHIIQQDIERSFPAGSVGIFAACSAASPKGRNTALLQKLNERGVDTLIASPFTIDADYGVVFATSFVEVVEEVTLGKRQPTILELFNRTILKTGQKFKAKNNGDYAELGLEYVLLGNPAITLCAPSALAGQ